jgi:hypothetical protein
VPRPLVETVEQPLQLLLGGRAGPPPTGEHAAGGGGAGVVEVPEDDEVDLRPCSSNRSSLNVPMKPLCRADCAASAPTAGRASKRAPAAARRTSRSAWKALSKAFKERQAIHRYNREGSRTMPNPQAAHFQGPARPRRDAPRARPAGHLRLSQLPRTKLAHRRLPACGFYRGKQVTGSRKSPWVAPRMREWGGVGSADGRGRARAARGRA